MKLAFYGSSLLSSYWNGAATYYRGILQALAARGYDITFYEPDAFDRQSHRDIEPPDWCRVVVYPASDEGVADALSAASSADIVVKASGVGYADGPLLAGAIWGARDHALTIFWDVDAPATLAELQATPDHLLHRALRKLDLVLTYGGGAPVVNAYRALGARDCVPIYNALDPLSHHPVPPDPRFEADLAFLGNRLPDREARAETFFFGPARALAAHRFLLGGSGWGDKATGPNVTKLDHVPTAQHNAFNVTPRAVLNIARDSMAETGFSPATRVFEACGAGACLITDYWQGIDTFLKPREEVLIAHDGSDVASILVALTPEKAAAIGAAGRKRILASHTYDRRAAELDDILRRELAAKRARAAA